MKTLNYYTKIYKAQLKKGEIQEAYSGLVKYVMSLGTALSKKLSDQFVFGNTLQGYMDYTYFYLSNDFLKKRKLKLAIVLNHKELQFEVWLLGQTLPVQEKYWQFFKTTKWCKNRESRPQYSILEAVLVEKPDFDDLDTLSKEIENKFMTISGGIIRDIKSSNMA